MKISDQKLCDYIFGLLDKQERADIEFELRSSDELRKRLDDLNNIFCGLDSVKDDFPSPFKVFMAKVYRVSTASSAVASIMILTWATIFGQAPNEFIQSSANIENAKSRPAYFSCTSDSNSSRQHSNNFEILSHLQE